MIYEYFCEHCNVKFDDFTHNRNKDKTECPYCGLISNRVPSISLFNTQSWKEKLKKEQEWARTPEAA
jgi:putative FmdB family regulatory protein